MHRSLRGAAAARLAKPVLAAAVLGAALLAASVFVGSVLAAEPTPTPDDPTSGTDTITLRGVIADPVTTHYHFFESLAGPTGSSNLLSGSFEASVDGSFALDLVRPQTAGEISVTIVEAPDATTTTVDEQGCTTSRVHGATLGFESAEAIAAGPVTVRLGETYELGLCPPAIGTPDGTWVSVGTTGQAPPSVGTSQAPSAAPSPTPELAQGVLGATGTPTVTPPATETSGRAPAPADLSLLWLAVVGLAVVVLGGVFSRGRRRSDRAPAAARRTEDA